MAYFQGMFPYICLLKALYLVAIDLMCCSVCLSSPRVFLDMYWRFVRLHTTLRIVYSPAIKIYCNGTCSICSMSPSIYSHSMTFLRDSPASLRFITGKDNLSNISLMIHYEQRFAIVRNDFPHEIPSKSQWSPKMSQWFPPWKSMIFTWHLHCAMISWNKDNIFTFW